jgi:hypothetical protein
MGDQDDSGSAPSTHRRRTDSECKYAYDRKAHVSKLDKALDPAAPNNWTVTSMKDDWKRDFAFA